MNLFKKIILGLAVCSISVTMVACSSKKQETKKEEPVKKTEYITGITKENVEEIVIEYKEILSYYNDLKNNLKTINDVSKKPDLERDALTAKDSLKNSSTLLKTTEIKYKPLSEAKDVLLKMYSTSLDMADNVDNDTKKYDEKSKEYDLLFTDFKNMMDQIRKDIEKVRGKTHTEDKKDQDQPTDSENKNNDNKDSQLDVVDNNKISEDNSNKNVSNSNNNDNKNNGNKNNNSGENSSGGFVPKVSSLNSSIRSEIKNAGSRSGVEFKKNGGSEANIEKYASQLFDNIEGDNPINENQLSEAKQIFIDAFKRSYYGN